MMKQSSISLFFFLLVSLLLISSSFANREVVKYGVVEGCSDWVLVHYPELKSFLKDGEAEEYENVELSLFHGRDAILTVTTRDARTGEVIDEEKIVLQHDYKTKESLHALFQEHFKKKGEAADKTIVISASAKKEEPGEDCQNAEGGGSGRLLRGQR